MIKRSLAKNNARKIKYSRGISSLLMFMRQVCILINKPLFQGTLYCRTKFQEKKQQQRPIYNFVYYYARFQKRNSVSIWSTERIIYWQQNSVQLNVLNFCAPANHTHTHTRIGRRRNKNRLRTKWIVLSLYRATIKVTSPQAHTYGCVQMRVCVCICEDGLIRSDWAGGLAGWSQSIFHIFIFSWLWTVSVRATAKQWRHIEAYLFLKRNSTSQPPTPKILGIVLFALIVITDLWN